jgi:hypothetical protein
MREKKSLNQCPSYKTIGSESVFFLKDATYINQPRTITRKANPQTILQVLLRTAPLQLRPPKAIFNKQTSSDG